MKQASERKIREALQDRLNELPEGHPTGELERKLEELAQDSWIDAIINDAEIVGKA